MSDLVEAVRATGLTAREETIQAMQDEAEETTVPETPEEREHSFQRPGFARMRTEWHGDDQITIEQVKRRVEEIIDTTFNDMFAIMNDLYDVVRIPEKRPDGTIVIDRFGWNVWARNDDGNYIENWSLLGHSQQTNFLLITTRLFEWEQRKDELWFDAMMAKTRWEEEFSIGWEKCETAKKTEGDRTASGRLRSMGERYSAVYRTYLSRRAESLVRGMERLAQRVKDVHTA